MSLFCFKDIMKVAIILLLLCSHSLIWANNKNNSELGRSLANYQACSAVSLTIKDGQMFIYYQKMFNDVSLDLLSFTGKYASQSYRSWDESEKVLAKLDEAILQKMCSNRFDGLSRKMLDKIVTQ